MGSEDVYGPRGRSSQDWGVIVALLALCVVSTFPTLVVVLAIVHAVRHVDGGDDLAAIADLFRTLVWPAVLLVCVARFEEPLVEVFNAVRVSA
jgi:hypothetical protein